MAWGSAQARALILSEAVSTPLEATPGVRHTYSDLGFLVLLAVIEGVTGERVETVWARRVAEPLRLTGLCWKPGFSKDIVATEDCPRRGRAIEGEVHDLNTAALGGTSTHAGLFGTGEGVAAAGQAFLDCFHGRRPGCDAWQGVLRRAWSESGAGSHRLGWDGRSVPGSTGDHFPADSVGHLGYTGTSLWIAPRQQVVVAFLTNRVHPSVEDQRIRVLRPRVHDAVVRALENLGRWDGSGLGSAGEVD